MSYLCLFHNLVDEGVRRQPAQEARPRLCLVRVGVEGADGIPRTLQGDGRTRLQRALSARYNMNKF